METPAVPKPKPIEPDDDGVDVTLIRWMLSLTPSERLEVLQKHVDAVEAVRDGIVRVAVDAKPDSTLLRH